MTLRVAMAVAFVLASPLANPATETKQTSVSEASAAPPSAARQPASAPQTSTAAADGRFANPYAGISNEELADVADRWELLTRDERRWFFVEVRKRLVAADGAPSIPLGASARFGQVVRNRDGTVAHIETTPVTAQPAGTTDARDDPRAYGLGFERRLGAQAGSEANAAPASVRLPAGFQRPDKPEGGT